MNARSTFLILRLEIKMEMSLLLKRAVVIGLGLVSWLTSARKEPSRYQCCPEFVPVCWEMFIQPPLYHVPVNEADVLTVQFFSPSEGPRLTQGLFVDRACVYAVVCLLFYFSFLPFFLF
jgi:hypothetical protein